LDSTLESPPKSYKIFEIKKCGDSRNEVIADDYIDSIPAKFDIPESKEELEMLSELEELENGEEKAKPRRQNGGKNNNRRGKPGNHDRTDRENSGHAGGDNFRRRNNNSGMESLSGDRAPHGKPHSKYKGKPHSGKKGSTPPKENDNSASKNKGE
ncbi:MAG: hypothetical protein ACI4IJ_09730, partial [Acutalibacteraceae bacterium]